MKRDIENAELFVFNDQSKSFEKLGEISEEITATNTEPKTSPSEELKQLNRDFATSFEVQIDNFNKYTFYLLIGEKYRIPNNWLKHHGQPMNKKPWKKTPAIIKQFRREMRRRKKLRRFDTN